MLLEASLNTKKNKNKNQINKIKSTNILHGNTIFRKGINRLYIEQLNYEDNKNK